MEHTKDCINAFALYDALVADYRKNYPHHCRRCGGWGGWTSTYDPSPSGVSLSPGFMYDYDPCPECSDKGKCPRCGALAYYEEDDDDKVRCRGCGFTEGEDDGEPQPPECYCWAIIKEE